MKTNSEIWYMVNEEVHAAHTMYEALIARHYDFNQVMADICMSMNHDIIEVIDNIKPDGTENCPETYVQQFDSLMYKVHSILLIKPYIDDDDCTEMIGNIKKEFIRRLGTLIEKYMSPEVK